MFGLLLYNRDLLRPIGKTYVTVPVSVATFSDPRLTDGIDPDKNPTQAVAYWMRRDIIRGVFAPLERLKVEQLTQFYDIGHSPVREAILLVSARGLTEHEHNKGYRVAGTSLADYSDLIDIYRRMYHVVLQMAVERGGEAWEERVVLALHRSLKVSKVMTDGDPQARETWQLAHKGLLAEIVSGCGSPILTDMVGILGDRAERYVNLYADPAADRERDSHAEHRAIVDAIVTGDADRLHALLDRLFEGGEPMRDTIRRKLAELEVPKGRQRAASAPLP